MTTQPDTKCLEQCLITQALSGLCVGLILTNPDERIIWLNRTAARVLGQAPSACIGRPLPQLLRDLQLNAFWREAAESKGNILADIEVHWPQKLSLKANATRYVGEQGEVGRALLFCDVTAERTLQLELSDKVVSRLLDLTSQQPVPPPAAHLTEQETRTLRLVGRGLSNTNIASDMGISASTVRSHLKNIYRKLGLGSRAEAVSFAARNNLL